MAIRGAVTWFEVGTDKPEEAKKFYGELFGWSFAPEEGFEEYDLITRSGADKPEGGIFNTGGNVPNYAISYVQVDDVAATLKAAEQRGGKVLVPQQGDPQGLQFAHVLDPHGNHIGVYTPPPSA